MEVNATIFACYDKSCAPPPAGHGGSSKGGGAGTHGAGRTMTPRANALFSMKSNLTGPTMDLMHPADAERKGLTAEGYHVLTTRGNKGTAYARPTGNTVPASRTRPALVEYDLHEVKTVVKNVNGRPTVMGEPGAKIGKTYALKELHD